MAEDTVFQRVRALLLSVQQRHDGVVRLGREALAKAEARWPQGLPKDVWDGDPRSELTAFAHQREQLEAVAESQLSDLARAEQQHAEAQRARDLKKANAIEAEAREELRSLEALVAQLDRMAGEEPAE